MSEYDEGDESMGLLILSRKAYFAYPIPSVRQISISSVARRRRDFIDVALAVQLRCGSLSVTIFT